MKPLYSKIIFAIALTASISILVGTILGVSGLIMGGVISLFCSAILGMSIMISNSTYIKEPNNAKKHNTTVVMITNPIV